MVPRDVTVIQLKNTINTTVRYLRMLLVVVFNNNNNTGYLLHAISPKSKENIACYKHIHWLQITETLLQNIVTELYRRLTTHYKNTHSSNEERPGEGKYAHV